MQRAVLARRFSICLPFRRIFIELCMWAYLSHFVGGRGCAALIAVGCLVYGFDMSLTHSKEGLEYEQPTPRRKRRRVTEELGRRPRQRCSVAVNYAFLR